MKIFKLPDLGEGLSEAEIVAWHVTVGERVVADQPLLSVETAKAIVDIPSPRSGRIARLYGQPGELVHIGDSLVEFTEKEQGAAEAATVVGRVETSSNELPPREAGATRAPMAVKATPAVRALARQLDLDLAIVTPSGPEGMITAADVQRAAKLLADVGPLQPLKGVRRTMAHTVALAHTEVVPVSICDDADVEPWVDGGGIMLRLIRAIIVACRAEPALNAWYDSHAVGRRLLKQVHLGIAVDAEDGLFLPVLRDVANYDPLRLREALEALRRAVRARIIAPEELRGYTIALSNFGTFAGRYANPLVIPPSVAILGAGRIRPTVVAAEGKAVVHRVLPVSVTFDHRAVTGGEAARFLGVVLDDLAKPE
jgi:2-oxoisovalerate dehydrogenase E2 component (dihydrolipoyl transacylase)